MWHTIAERITHTSVAATKRIIGHSEFVDWIAYFKIRKEEEEEAARKAQKR